MANDIEIVRDLGAIVEAFEKVKKEMSGTKDDLSSVNRALRLDSENVDLLAKRSELLARQLEENKQKSELLGEAITELNRIKAESGSLDAAQEKQLASFTKQQKDAENQIIGLTGNLQKQADATVTAEESTKSFSKSMTEFQSNLRAANQAIGGINNAFKMLGGDPDSTMGKFLSQSQQAVQMMSGMASMGKLLSSSNSTLAKSFGMVAMAAGAAVAAYSLGTSIIDAFGEENRKTASIIAISTAAFGGLAVAAMAAAGAISWGTAVPIIMAAIGVGAAGITSLLKKETDNLETATAANLASTSGGASTASMSTPSVPTYSGSSSGASNVTVQTLSEKQIESAVYAAVTRMVIEQGLNETTIIDKTTLTRSEFHRWFFRGILDPQTGTINAREVL